MAPAVPFPKGVADLFLPERLAKGAIVGDIRVFFAHRNNHILATQRVQKLWIADVRCVMAGRVEIDVVVVIAVEKAGHVILAAEGQHPAK